MADLIHNPEHYRKAAVTVEGKAVQPIDLCRHYAFEPGCAMKYILRAPYKGCRGLDLQKAGQFLAWMREAGGAYGPLEPFADFRPMVAAFRTANPLIAVLLDERGMTTPGRTAAAQSALEAML